jgi:hypothetical protein
VHFHRQGITERGERPAHLGYCVRFIPLTDGDEGNRRVSGGVPIKYLVMNRGNKRCIRSGAKSRIFGGLRRHD